MTQGVPEDRAETASVVTSVRLDPASVDVLKRIAESQRATTSDLIRAAVDWIAEMNGDELERLLRCRHCGGTGSRVRAAGRRDPEAR